jgi:dual specificity tyrosine-phosphorylation-regulated kinase 2/3/4
MFNPRRSHAFPCSARREKAQQAAENGLFAPHPPKLLARENVDESQAALKLSPMTVRGSNPRFHQIVGPLSQRRSVTLVPVIPNGPIAPEDARTHYGSLLTPYELHEIGDFPDIYYVGHLTKKIRASKSVALNSGFDDSQHHYRAVIGDHIAYRFEIRAVLGKGAFGQVLRCYDHKLKQHVALKVIVNTDLMHQQGRIECLIVQQLNLADADGSYHVIRGLDFFVFRRHICAAFEILGANLYEYSRSIRFRPIAPHQVKPLAKQMLEAIAFCHANNIVHCDLKPENVLIGADGFPNVKIIDFGSSCFVGQQRYEYIQSRFYRAPEVILGIKYGPPMDVWSFALIVVEIITGKPLFPGDSEREVLEMFMEVLGPVPQALRQAGSRKKEFYNADGKFVRLQGKGEIRRIGSSSLEAATRISDLLLIDLLKKCLTWAQEERITASDALNHPWFGVREVATARASMVHILPELIR